MVWTVKRRGEGEGIISAYSRERPIANFMPLTSEFKSSLTIKVPTFLVAIVVAIDRVDWGCNSGRHHRYSSSQHSRVYGVELFDRIARRTDHQDR